MIGDAGQEAAIGAVADLVDAEHHQPVQPAAIELVSDDALEDLADRPPADPHQPGQRRLGHLLRQERHDVLEVARVGGPGARPRHRLEQIAATRTAQAPQLALDKAARGAEIEMPPALHAPVLDLQADRAAARAHPSPAAQADRHDHPLPAERHILNRRPRKPEHPVKCRGDPHVVLLRRPRTLRTASSLPQKDDGGSPRCAQTPGTTYKATNRLLSRRSAETPHRCHPRTGR